MGGVSGHLNHLYDNRDLTYDEIGDILIKAAAGELVGTEKTDGFNIFLGFVNGEPRAARNKGDMAKGGMTFDDLLARKFQGGDRARRAYVEAFDAYAKAVSTLSEKEITSIFGEDGEIFYNAEIQGPLAANVVNYDDNVINIHRMGHKRYNHDNNQLEVVDNEKESAALDSLIDRFEEVLATEPFNVRRTAFLELNKLTDEGIVNDTLARIKATGLAGDVTIDDLLERALLREIKSQIPNLDGERQRQVVERILKREDHLSLTQIAKGLGREIKDQITLFVKEESPKIIKEKMWPLEAAIHDFAVELLRGVHSAYVLDNDHEVEKLKKEVESAIRAIQKYQGPYKEEAHDILRHQLEKLKHHDNVDTVVEGFAFQYCHKGGDCAMYKFTGNFAPINQLLGLFKYGRGKMPAMNLNEQEHRIERVIALYPGRFQPMGRHHAEVFRKIQEERGYDNSFIVTADAVNTALKDGVPKSPYTFDEKQLIASQYDIPSSKIVFAESPYNAVEVLEDYDPNTTAVIYFVGAKDMATRFGDLGGVKSDGTPRYFREYNRGEDLKGWMDHGYIAVAPHVSIDIPEVGEMSGTNLKKALRDGDEDTFKSVMGFYDREIYDIIKDKLEPTGLEEAQHHLGIFRGLMEEVLEEEKAFGSFPVGVVGRGGHRVSGLRDDGPCEEDDEELDETAAMANGAVQVGARRPVRREKEEEDKIVNEFYSYLLNNLEG